MVHCLNSMREVATDIRDWSLPPRIHNRRPSNIIHGLDHPRLPNETARLGRAIGY